MNVEQPFVGVYGVVNNGPFTFDGLVRRDFYNLGVSAFDGTGGNIVAPGGNTLHGQGWSGILNTQYHYGFGGGWFIEPSVALLLAEAEIDPLSLTLTSSSSTQANWSNLDSVTGRVGVRFGRSFLLTPDIVMAPYTAFSLWRDFAGNSLSTLNVGPGEVVSVSTQNVGTFEQLSFGTRRLLDDARPDRFCPGRRSFRRTVQRPRPERGLALSVLSPAPTRKKNNNAKRGRAALFFFGRARGRTPNSRRRAIRSQAVPARAALKNRKNDLVF